MWPHKSRSQQSHFRRLCSALLSSREQPRLVAFSFAWSRTARACVQNSCSFTEFSASSSGGCLQFLLAGFDERDVTALRTETTLPEHSVSLCLSLPEASSEQEKDGRASAVRSNGAQASADWPKEWVTTQGPSDQKHLGPRLTANSLKKKNIFIFREIGAISKSDASRASNAPCP